MKLKTLLFSLATLTLLLLALLAGGASAQTVERYDAFSEQGGKRPVTAGSTSTTTVQQTIPGATVTVYFQGTLNLATIYADRSLTPKSNPFTSDPTTGYFFFYADPSVRYDVQLSGGTSPNNLPGAVTRGDQIIRSLSPVAPGIPTTGLLAHYKFLDGTGTTLTDSSGNAFHGTLVNSPTWTNGGLSFTRASAQRVSLPGGLTSTVRSIVVVATHFLPNNTNTGTNTVAIVGNSGAGSGVRLLESSDSKNVNPGIGDPIGGVTTTSADTIGGITPQAPQMITAVLDAAQDTIYIGTNPTNVYQNRAGHFSGPFLVNQFQLGGDVTMGYYQGTMYYALFYSVALTQQQVVQIYETINNSLRARGTALAPTSYVSVNQNLALGDDLTAGGGGGTSYVPSLSLVDTFTTTNLGFAGKTAQQIALSFPSYNTTYNGWAKRNVAVVWAGTNDYVAGRTTAQITADLRAICHNLVAQGFRVVLVTMISRTGQDANKNLLNAVLRSDWREITDGGALADVAGNANLGADGAFSNGTYFVSNFLLTPTGAGIAASIISDAINALSGGGQTTSGIVTTATSGAVSMNGEDNVLRANPSGGNITINMVPCTGSPGRRVEIKNLQSVGANTVTLDPSGAETVDGAATRLVPNFEGAILVCNGTGNWDVVSRFTQITITGGVNQLAYILSASSIGGITGATSDGTNATFGAGNLRATSPRITTNIFDTNGLSILDLNPGAAATNRLAISNINGANPGITVAGVGANIGIDYTAKGTNNVLSMHRFFETLQVTTSAAGGVNPIQTVETGDAPLRFSVNPRGKVTTRSGYGSPPAGDYITLGGSYDRNFTTATTSGTGLTALYTKVITANCMGEEGDTLIFYIWGRTTNGTADFVFNITLNGSNVYNETHNTDSTNQHYFFTVIITRASSSTANVGVMAQFSRLGQSIVNNGGAFQVTDQVSKFTSTPGLNVVNWTSARTLTFSASTTVGATTVIFDNAFAMKFATP